MPDRTDAEQEVGCRMRYGSKYGNIPSKTGDGVLHDSRKEAQRWAELQMLEKANLIKNLQRQVKYELIPKQEGERSVTYIADFVYDDENGKHIVEDCKGMRTPAYVIKRKLMLYVHGIKILET